eukprot:TRINITY_DN7662_c1_g1_i1.p2 TRINITY_DN7662_c1_g1~~TRINITY_DN7662_c1_g1_i1.p2  ORF type:complete len:102 (+),score=28.02 TRINITY_DN7662_c1_g1_i1:271-576(+)
MLLSSALGRVQVTGIGGGSSSGSSTHLRAQSRSVSVGGKRRCRGDGATPPQQQQQRSARVESVLERLSRGDAEVRSASQQECHSTSSTVEYVARTVLVDRA